MEFYDAVLSSEIARRLHQPLRVTYKSSADCWVSLPATLAGDLHEVGAIPAVLELGPVNDTSGLSAKPSWLVAWAGEMAAGNTLGVPRLLGHTLGLPEGLMVTAKLRANLPVADYIEVEPLSSSDWEVLEQNAGHLEGHFLSQVLVVSEGQVVPVFVRQQVVIRIKVVSTHPDRVVRLAAGSEVRVVPKVRAAASSPHEDSDCHAVAKLQGVAPGSRGPQDQESASTTAPRSWCWLRVFPAAPDALLRVFPAAPDALLSSPCKIIGSGRGTQRSGGKSEMDPGGDVRRLRPEGPGTWVKSWITTSITTCRQVLQRLGVKPGDVVEVQSSWPLAPNLFLIALEEPAIPDHHLTLTPPLQQCLGLMNKMRVRVRRARTPWHEPGSPQLCRLRVHMVVPSDGLPSPPKAPPDPSSTSGGRDAGASCSGRTLPSDSLTQDPHIDPQCADLVSCSLLHWLCRWSEEGDLGKQGDAGGRGRPGPGGTYLHPQRCPEAAFICWLNLQLEGMRSRMSPWEKAADPDPPLEGCGKTADEGLAFDGDRGERGRQGGCSSTSTTSSHVPAVALGSGVVMHLKLGRPKHKLGAALQASNGAAVSGPSAHQSTNISVQEYTLLLLPDGPSSAKSTVFLYGAQCMKAGADRRSFELTRRRPLVLPFPSDRSTPGVFSGVEKLPGSPLRLKRMEWLSPQLSQCLRRLVPMLQLKGPRQARQVPKAGGVVITGSPGSGKSTLVRVVAQIVGCPSSLYAHPVVVHCKELLGRRFTEVQAVLSGTFNEALQRQPGLVVLEELDLLCPADKEGPDSLQDPQEADVGARLAHWLVDVMDDLFRQDHAVAVMATCKEAAMLMSVLRQATCLDFEVRLSTPGVQGRATMMAEAMRERGVAFKEEDLVSLASKAEGYDAADLRLLMDRAVHQALTRSLTESYQSLVATGKEEPLEVTCGDLKLAFEGFTPPSFWGLSGGPRGPGAAGVVEGWQDVGGLDPVKRAMYEALVLPTKYSGMLSRAPLRLRTGLLLFGPPGCGKTHVVSAAVAATGLRFISVKGPELLNKYIGQSEEAVREVFRRAAAAAPCILFFDEFDALAPQRGHDSTGVTDRVVNQLLTELDGVEGLKGVCVLGATSRPDLIDAALLRPGRLDRLVHCNLPNEQERRQILKALSRKMPLAPDVELDWVADNCPHFSGADLGAVLSEAQLRAVHEKLEGQQHRTSGQGAWISEAGGPSSSRQASSNAVRPLATSSAKTLNPLTSPVHDLSGPPPSDIPSLHPASTSGTGPPPPPSASHGVVVCQHHLVAAVHTAHPSLPASERRRLDTIYQRFLSSRDVGVGNTVDKGKGKRTTLA